MDVVYPVHHSRLLVLPRRVVVSTMTLVYLHFFLLLRLHPGN
jgi:hypothetical protein